MRRGAAVHSWSRSTTSSRSSVITSNEAKSSRSCAGVAMPAWCGPWNGNDRVAVASRRGASGARDRLRPSASPARGASGAQQRAPRKRRRVARRSLLHDDDLPPPSRAARPARRSPGEQRVSALGERRCRARSRRPPVRPRGAAITAAKRASISSTSSGPRREERLHRVERGLRALDVGLEVDEVGVRVALLLTGDLRRRDLVEQLDRAVGDLGRLELDVCHQVCSASTSAFSLVGDGRCPRWCRRPRAPARSGGTRSTPCRDVALAGVDLGVEVAEGLGHRLDALVRDPRRGVERLGLLDVAGLDRGGERLGRRRPSCGLLDDVGAVRRDRRLGLGAGRRAGASPVTVSDAALGASPPGQ